MTWGLNYRKPMRDPWWFNVISALGCAIAIIVLIILILDRFGLSLPALIRRV